MNNDSWSPPEVLLTVDLVILTLRGPELCVLLVERGVPPYRGARAVPGGFLNHAGEDLLEAARRELREEADLDAGALHLEQLGTYGSPGRDPRGRVISVAYLAIAPGLPDPVAGTDAADADWVAVAEVLTGRTEVAFDHHQIVNDAVERARCKLEHSALAPAFCDETFTLVELQQVYEAVWGVILDPRNFYRKVQKIPGFLEPVNQQRKPTKGRPARLFRAGSTSALHPPLVRPGRSER